MGQLNSTIFQLNLKIDDNYVPSEGEINNIVYLTCKYTCGWIARQCDVQICSMMAGQVVGAIGISKLVQVTCEFCWDHVCGEPDVVSTEDFYSHIKPVLERWYENTDEEQRSNTEWELA